MEESSTDGDFRSLKHQLQAVNLENPAAVITVREIKGLGEPGGGSNVEARLKSYFERYGDVKNVLVPRAPAKAASQSSKKGANIKGGNRVRSSNVGWVVMESPGAVLQILGNVQHRVFGVTVRVEEFRRSNLDSDTSVRQAQSTERSSSSDSMKSSTTATTAATSHQVGTPLDPSSPPYQAVGSHMTCHIQMPWGSQPLVAPGVFQLPEQQAPIQPPLSQVFCASAEELRLAMPASYDD